MTKINFKTPKIDEDASAWINTYPYDELCIPVLDADDKDKRKIVLIFGRAIVSDRFCNLNNVDKDTAKKEVIEKLKIEENGKLLIKLTEQALEDQEVQKGLQSDDRIGQFYVPERVLRDYR